MRVNSDQVWPVPTPEEALLDRLTEAFRGLSLSIARDPGWRRGAPDEGYQTPDIRELLKDQLKETMRADMDLSDPEMPAKIEKMERELLEKGYPLPAGDPLLSEGVYLGESLRPGEGWAHRETIYELVDYELKQGASWTTHGGTQLLQSHSGAELVTINPMGAVDATGLFSLYPTMSIEAKRARNEANEWMDEYLSEEERQAIGRRAMEPKVYWEPTVQSLELIEQESDRVVARLWVAGPRRGEAELFD